MAKIMKEIEAWLEIYNSAEDVDIKMAANEYMDMLRDNIIDVRTSIHERTKILNHINKSHE